MTIQKSIEDQMNFRSLSEKIPTTSGRVPEHTSKENNERILEATRLRLDEIGNDPARIEARLIELEHEWDVERTLEVNAATVALLGLSLGAAVSRKWFVFPAVVAAFLFQHAVQGWCPPLPVFRRLGIRTSREIELERIVLKARRGDLEKLSSQSSSSALRSLAV